MLNTLSNAVKKLNYSTVIERITNAIMNLVLRSRLYIITCSCYIELLAGYPLLFGPWYLLGWRAMPHCLSHGMSQVDPQVPQTQSQALPPICMLKIIILLWEYNGGLMQLLH